jgi:hypothetical protein
MTVNPATAKITGNLDTAVPDVHFQNGQGVACHLTQGFDKAVGWTNGKAFTAVGEVGIAGSVADWGFGFIQLCRAKFCGAFYAGRIPSEGSIGLRSHNPPALPKAVLLDSDDDFSPWTSASPRFSVDGSAIHANTGDHPATAVHLNVTNRMTKVPNFLFHVVDIREFVTIFTAKDPGGARQYLAHFEWTLVYDFKFSWRGGNPVKVGSLSSFPRGAIQSIRGAPTASVWQALLANPTGPQCNDQTKKAIHQAGTGGQGPNRSDNTGYFNDPANNVPPDFWQ